MPRRRKEGRRFGKDRRFSIRSELRKQPDITKIAKAVIALAIAQAEREAQEQATETDPAIDQGQSEGTADA